MKKTNGSTKLGPSRAYLRLLEGRTSPEDYARVLRRSTDMRRTTPKSVRASSA
jgi:hypothetical protein